MRIAVVITTYNRPDALSSALDGYYAQRDENFELIVADDGSADETAQVVTAYKRKPDFKLSHVWQKDDGFRAAAIRNRAIAETSADYIIFTDGDCIPLPDFVSQHRALAERGWFLVGSRILLSKPFTDHVLKNRVPVHTWTVAQWIRAWVKKDINRWLPVLPLPVPAPLRKLLANKWEGATTCNLSAWRDDLLRINGLDESYSGWGLEDSDIVIRLLRSGIRRKSARFATPLLHLWHRENDRTNLERNRKTLDNLLNSRRIRAIHGVKQYL
jgi:glycosyltransferase involved in cell wall biosynthesis